MAIRDRMFLGMQDFVFLSNFTKICLNLTQFIHICPNFIEICPNWLNFAQFFLKSARGCGYIPTSYATVFEPLVKGAPRRKMKMFFREMPKTIQLSFTEDRLGYGPIGPTHPACQSLDPNHIFFSLLSQF